MTDSFEFSPVTGDPQTETAPESDRPVPEVPPPGALRQLARGLLSVAAEVVAARRAPLGVLPEVRGLAVSFGRSGGRQSWRHSAASPDVTGPGNAKLLVGAPSGLPVVDADSLGSVL